MTSNVLYEVLIRSYERFKYFSQTLNLTMAKNTNVNKQKSKHHKNWISTAKSSEYLNIQKNLNTRLVALNSKLRAFYVSFFEAN